jgi:hypothetical protein
VQYHGGVRRLSFGEATRKLTRVASVLLESSSKKRAYADDIPLFVRMSGQSCTILQ